jgi:hypothetical protein
LDAGNSGEKSSEDDKFEDELRALTGGTASEARFREPAAAERDKLAKRARKERAADAKLYAKLEKEAQKKVLKDRRKAQRKANRGRLIRRTAWALSMVVLAGACVFAYVRFHPASGSGGADDTQVVTNGAVPKISASGPPADLFAGTPADKWAAGAAGITIPAAKAHGRYPAAQVESAYQATKKLLVAAALDNQTLYGGAPTAFAKLLTQDERNQYLSELNKTGVDKSGKTLSSRDWIMQFAPGTTKLIGSAIKVQGSMQAKATTDSHGQPVLEVDVNYLFTYAVEPPTAPADWMRIVTHIDGPVQFGDWADADSPFEPWWEPGIWVAGARCSSRDGFVHPDYPTGPADSVQPSGRPVDPYSLKEKPNGCTLTTGT